MHHMRICMVIILLGVPLWFGGTAMAFTLRLGPVSDVDASSAAPVIGETDLPTPQFFRMAIGQGGLTLGVERPSDKYALPEPEIRFEKASASPANDHQFQQANNPFRASRLSGVELLLLRKTQMTADRLKK